MDQLIDSLKDADPDMKKKVIEVLRKIKDPRAIEPLIGLLGDENLAVRLKAAWALRKITGQRYGQDPSSWQDWWEGNKDRLLTDDSK